MIVELGPQALGFEVAEARNRRGKSVREGDEAGAGIDPSVGECDIEPAVQR